MKKHKLFSTMIVSILLTSFIHTALGVTTSIPFTNINMETDDVLNYEGVRIVLFFKPNCPSCHNQIETLQELENNYTLSIIALNVDSETTNTTLLDLIEDLSLSTNWTLGYASSQAISTFDLTVVPSQVILDNNSEIVAVTEGYFDYESIETKILDAINHRTDNYSENPISDSGDLLTALFIIIGVAVATVVVIFLFRLFKRSDKTTNMIIASKKLEKLDKTEKDE
ncbi:MAG: conjugal transfer protein TraF [Candidatus Heimdallarchaeota archaeon]|nr:conjugal transfer protein TraF [Candidatus Heimdallarchaeota archaeon]